MQCQVATAASRVQAEAGQHLAESRESFRLLVQRQFTATERRVDALHDEVARTRREQDRQASEHQRVWQHIDQMRDTLALAEAQTPIADLSRLAEWDRQPDPTLCVAGCQRLLAPSVVLNDLQELIAEANLQSNHVELPGDGETARRFALQAKGGNAVA
eukprot:7807570-Pyramimonas_sp.AAC.1